MRHYQHIVVGAGLIGSAAAKYLAEAGEEVLLIGPSEPVNYQDASYFSSHYDYSRVQRIIGWNSAWTQLNKESAEHWPFLEEETGIKFHNQDGCLYVAPQIDEYLKSAPEIAEQFHLEYQSVDDRASLESFAPEFNFDREVVGLYEKSPAGSINPRLLISAQQKAFNTRSGNILEDIVVNIQKAGKQWKVETKSGDIFTCTNILVASGSFSRFTSPLISNLNIITKTEVVINAEISEEDAMKLANIPSLLYEIYENDFDGIYLIKPQRFSDGKWYLKMGLNQSKDNLVDNLSDLQNWFRSDQHKQYLPVLKRELFKLFPEIDFLSLQTKPCVISRTINSNPYIDMIEEGFFVATGCNGYSAMSSDAQGRVAATLMRFREYESGYAHKDFAAIFK